jgi:hypothetical protein
MFDRFRAQDRQIDYIFLVDLEKFAGDQTQ